MIGHSSVVTQKKILHFIKSYFFSSFKIGNLFGVKDPIPDEFRSCVVYKFAFAGCNACCVGETTRHFSSHVRDHVVSDRPPTFSNTYRILNIVAPCVQWTVSIFQITP